MAKTICIAAPGPDNSEDTYDPAHPKPHAGGGGT